MSPERIALVRDSWALVSRNPDSLAHRFYEQLFKLAPHTKAMFAGTGLNAQGRKFVEMLGTIVQSLGEPAELEEIVAALGKRHADYGVKLKDYPTVGDALLFALQQELGDAMPAATRSAWAEAYDVVASMMIRSLDPW